MSKILFSLLFLLFLSSQLTYASPKVILSAKDLENNSSFHFGEGAEFKEDGLHYEGGQNGGLNVQITDHYYPSLQDKATSLAFTLAAGSLQGQTASLFSGLFNKNRPEDTGIKEGVQIDLGYVEGVLNAQWKDMGSTGGLGVGEPLPMTFPSDKDITVIINQTSSLNPEGVGDGSIYITVSLYLGREQWGHITLNQHETYPGSLYDFTLGDANCSFTLKGLGKYYNDSIFSGDNLSEYFNTVGVTSIPESGSVILSLCGLILFCLRHKK